MGQREAHSHVTHPGGDALPAQCRFQMRPQPQWPLTTPPVAPIPAEAELRPLGQCASHTFAHHPFYRGENSSPMGGAAPQSPRPGQVIGDMETLTPSLGAGGGF